MFLSLPVYGAFQHACCSLVLTFPFASEGTEAQRGKGLAQAHTAAEWQSPKVNSSTQLGYSCQGLSPQGRGVGYK